MQTIYFSTFLKRSIQRGLLLLLIVFLFAGQIYGQTILQVPVSGIDKEGKLTDLFLSLENDNPNFRFHYLPEWLENYNVSADYNGYKLSELLDELFRSTDLQYIAMYPNVLVIVKDPTGLIERKQWIEEAYGLGQDIEKVTIGGSEVSKVAVEVSGSVIDWATGEPLPYTTIEVSGLKDGELTNELGEYSVTLMPGSYVFRYSFLGYDDKSFDVELKTNGRFDVQLEKQITELDEFVVQGDLVSAERANVDIGVTSLDMKELERRPTFLGEVDLVKQIQNLTGVSTVGEASTGFNVRGGSVDQNLILYDGLSVYNSSHALGFVTAFNSDAIRKVDFYKGGIPSKYGGRASSVLSIETADGSYSKWSGSAGIGLFTGNFTINGPLKEGKTSVLLSLRSTYSDWLTQSIRTDYVDLRNSSVFFYDGTAKVSHLLDDRTKLTFTAYSSQDAFSLVADTTYNWHNNLFSARFEKQLTADKFLEVVLGHSSYGYDIENSDLETASELDFRIATTTLKAGMEWDIGKHQISYGFQASLNNVLSGSIEPKSSQSNVKFLELPRQKSIEAGLYLSDEWAVTDKLKVTAGLRLPVFLTLGPEERFIYMEGESYAPENVVDSVYFSGGEVSKAYLGFEPRLSVKYMLSTNSSIKLGYNRINQYLHLVTNTTAVTPLDIWQPSNYYFKPQVADQVSSSFSIDSKNKRYGATIGMFFKQFSNVTDFKEGAELILNEHLETELRQGKGLSYGMELGLSKNIGRLTTTLNYTYSRAFREIKGRTDDEAINEGNRYPANFDQPHNLNLSWQYNISKRHFFTGSFIYRTGRPITVPLSSFSFENSSTAYFSERNQYRIPNYHRLDLAFVIEGNHSLKRRVKGKWVFSVYNVYGRKNPYTIFFKNSEDGIPQPYQLSIIGTIFPSVSYNLEF